MRTNKYTRTRKPHLVAAALAAFVAIAIGAATGAQAGRISVTGAAHTDVRVWVDETWDVFPSYDDVTISIRAARDCYATVYLVDTDGFVHVIHPFSPYDDAWIEAGVTYTYCGRDIGLGALAGRGIAYVFAVGSPYEFDYAAYGDGVFVGRYGYRIFGDPFVASRQLYVSFLPTWCEWDYIGVSYARFYVREWARYPRYLCHGHHGTVHVRAGNYCRHCYRAYDNYRLHASDPYRVIRPTSRYKTAARTRIERSTHAYKNQARERSKVQRKAARRPARDAKIISSKRSNRTKMSSRTTAKPPSKQNIKRTKAYKSAKVSKSSKATVSKRKISSRKTRSTRSKAGASR